MDLLVNDVTSLNSNTAFRSDVQISQFRTPLNADLVRTFMFTAGTFREKKSSAELLGKLCDAAQSEVVENRFLVKANFGHGKSHFALAVANFFGKTDSSEEVAALLGNLEHTINNPAVSEGFRAFKRHRKPYLVILLRGDAPGDLRDKFPRCQGSCRVKWKWVCSSPPPPVSVANRRGRRRPTLRPTQPSTTMGAGEDTAREVHRHVQEPHGPETGNAPGAECRGTRHRSRRAPADAVALVAGGW
jgi:hypothetical protein